MELKTTESLPLRLADRKGTPATRTHRTLLVTGAVAALALGAAMIVQGDWQPALAAFAGVSGVAFLRSLTRLLAIGERPAWPDPSAPRRRTLARPVPAAEPAAPASRGAALDPCTA